MGIENIDPDMTDIDISGGSRKITTKTLDKQYSFMVYSFWQYSLLIRLDGDWVVISDNYVSIST